MMNVESSQLEIVAKNNPLLRGGENSQLLQKFSDYDEPSTSASGIVFVSELISEHSELLDTKFEYLNRIAHLNKLAGEEGFSYSDDSYESLIKFLRKKPMIKLGFLFLLETGNFSAMWKDGDAQILLEFLDVNSVEYTLLRNPKRDNSSTAYSYGTSTIETAIVLINELQLSRLLYT